MEDVGVIGWSSRLFPQDFILQVVRHPSKKLSVGCIAEGHMWPYQEFSVTKARQGRELELFLCSECNPLNVDTGIYQVVHSFWLEGEQIMESWCCSDVSHSTGSNGGGFAGQSQAHCKGSGCLREKSSKDNIQFQAIRGLPMLAKDIVLCSECNSTSTGFYQISQSSCWLEGDWIMGTQCCSTFWIAQQIKEEVSWLTTIFNEESFTCCLVGK